MEALNQVVKRRNNGTLEKSYHKACSDKDFYDFMQTLNASDDVLMKYTTRLQECLIENKNCCNCPGQAFCKNKINGYKLTPIIRERKITFSYVACPKTVKILEQNKYKDNLKLFDISKDVSEASLKNIYTDDKARLPIIKYFKTFMDEYKKGQMPKGIYLVGSFGSGKTYLISALFNEMAKQNVRSASVYYPEFLRDLKASFSSDFKEKFEYVKKAPLLLLDDIGAENSTSWARDEILGPILQYRMEQHLPTFFTSNLTLEELEVNLSQTNTGSSQIKGRRIIERIKQLTKTMELISKNRRE